MNFGQDISSDDGGEHVAETCLEFRATGRVVHFDALAFAVDKAGFAQDFETLGEGAWQHAVVDLRKSRSRTFRFGHFGVDLGARWVGQGVEEALDGNVGDSRMEERPHEVFITRT